MLVLLVAFCTKNNSVKATFSNEILKDFKNPENNFIKFKKHLPPTLLNPLKLRWGKVVVCYFNTIINKSSQCTIDVCYNNANSTKDRGTTVIYFCANLNLGIWFQVRI